MKKGILIAVAVAFALAVVAPAFAEDTAQEKAETKAPLRKELIQLKYLRSSDRFYSFVNTYLSRDGRIAGGPTDRVIVVSDYAENVEKVLQVIRQIDVKPADLQITVQLVLGGETGEPGKESMTNDPIIQELKNLLKYRAYTQLDASLLRAMDNTDSEVRMGEKGEFEFMVRPKVIKDEKSSLIQMELRLRQFHEDPRVAAGMVEPAKGERSVIDLIGTTLNVKPGEKTVVGVSKLDGGGRGLILIISGKIVD